MEHAHLGYNVKVGILPLVWNFATTVPPTFRSVYFKINVIGGKEETHKCEATQCIPLDTRESTLSREPPGHDIVHYNKNYDKCASCNSTGTVVTAGQITTAKDKT